MSPLATFIVLLLAFLCFVLAAWGVVVTPRRPINLIAVGLALVTFVALYNAGVAL